MMKKPQTPVTDQRGPHSVHVAESRRSREVGLVLGGRRMASETPFTDGGSGVEWSGVQIL